MVEQMSKRKRKKGERDVIRLINNNYIRDMIIPRQHVERPAITLGLAEYERIKKNSRDIAQTLKDEQVKLAKEQELKLDAIAGRKKHLQKCQIKTDYDLNEGSFDHASSILATANKRIFEREMEIKVFNELIEGAKSHAIHDIQVREKQVIEHQRIEEEKRLRKLMEDDCEVNLRYQDNVKKQRKKLRQLIAEDIRKQISEREWDKLLKLEAKEQQNAKMLRHFEAMIAEDVRIEEEKKRKQRAVFEAMKESNEQLLKHKAMLKKQEDMENERIHAFQRNKAEREAAYEAEQERIKREKDIEINKMRRQQERDIDSKAEKQALMAKREMARLEKEWRRKELDDARKKAESDAELIESRIQQRKHKENNMAIQVANDRLEFENILKAQRAAMDKEKKEEEAAYLRARELIKDVQSQVREKEKIKIQERKANFQEGNRLREELYHHKLKIKNCKEKKLEEIYKTNIPKRYLHKMEHNLNETNKELETMRSIMEGTWKKNIPKPPFV